MAKTGWLEEVCQKLEISMRNLAKKYGDLSHSDLSRANNLKLSLDWKKKKQIIDDIGMKFKSSNEMILWMHNIGWPELRTVDEERYITEYFDLLSLPRNVSKGSGPNILQRQGLFRQIKDSIFSSKVGCVIGGIGGIGKTTLIASFLFNLRNEIGYFTDGVFWIDLERNRYRTPVFHLGQKLGIYADDEFSLRNKIYKETKDKHFLIVIDGADDLKEGISLKELIDSKYSRFIISTREGVNKTVAQQQNLDVVMVNNLSDSEGVDLIARTVDGDLSEEDKNSICQINEIVEGHPLALFILCSLRNYDSSLEFWNGTLTVLKTSQKKLDLLNLPNPKDRYDSVRICFDISYHRLSNKYPETAKLFDYFGILASGLIISNIIKEIIPEIGDSRRNYQELCHYGLISPIENTGNFLIHSLLQMFALEKLKEKNEYKEIAGKYSLYFSNLSSKIFPLYQNLSSDFDQFDKYLPEIIHAAMISISFGKFSQALDSIENIRGIYYSLNYDTEKLKEVIDYFDSSGANLDRSMMAKYYVIKSGIVTSTGSDDQVIYDLKMALQFADDLTLKIKIMDDLANMLNRTDDAPSARNYLNEIEQNIHRLPKGSDKEAAHQSWLAAKSQVTGSLTDFEIAQIKMDGLDLLRELILVKSALIPNLFKYGKYSSAQELLQEYDNKLSQNPRLKLHRVEILITLAIVKLSQGKLDDGLNSLKEVKQILDQLNPDSEFAISHFYILWRYMGECYLIKKDESQALFCMKNALSYVEKLSHNATERDELKSFIQKLTDPKN